MLAAYGCYISSYWILLISRVFGGFGMESNMVANKAIVGRWFPKMQMALGFSLVGCLWKLGPSLSSIITPYIYLYDNKTWIAMFFPVFLLLAGCIASIVAILINKKHYTK